MDTQTINHPYYNESCIKCNSCNCMYDITNNSELINMCGDCYLDLYEIDIYGETIFQRKLLNKSLIYETKETKETNICNSPKN